MHDISRYWRTAMVNRLVHLGLASANTCKGDRISMSISVDIDSPLDETLNRGPLVQLLRQQYEFPFRINILQFCILKC